MSYSIEAKERVEALEETRAAGMIPAVFYGPQVEAKSVAVDYRTFEKLYQTAGESNLIDLAVVNSDPAKVLIQEVQRDPVKGTIVHIDFRQIDMNKEISTAISLNYIGESAAVKEQGGTLMKGPDSLNIKCLPNDLVSQVDVDLSNLKTFEDIIRIGDLIMPHGITVVDNQETLVAKVAPPLTEDQLKAMEEAEATSVADIEVEGEKKEGEEGEAAEGEKKGEAKDESKAEEKGDKKE